VFLLFPLPHKCSKNKRNRRLFNAGFCTTLVGELLYIGTTSALNRQLHHEMRTDFTSDAKSIYSRLHRRLRTRKRLKTTSSIFIGEAKLLGLMEHCRRDPLTGGKALALATDAHSACTRRAIRVCNRDTEVGQKPNKYFISTPV